MIKQLLAWWNNFFVKENPPATFFRWLETKKAPSPTVVNWAGEIEDQWSLEVGSSSFMMDWECGYPREKKELTL